jgi:hypothetical protein
MDDYWGRLKLQAAAGEFEPFIASCVSAADYHTWRDLARLRT